MDNINLKQMVIHLVILWAATFLGGFLVGFVLAIAGLPLALELIGLSNFVITFVVVLCITLINKINWTHFLVLFVLLGATSLLNALLSTISIPQVIIGSVLITGIGALGKVLGDVILRGRET